MRPASGNGEGRSLRQMWSEWATQQSPLFVLLAAFGYWICFVAFPRILESHEQTMKEMREDDRLMREAVADMAARAEQQNRLLADLVVELRRR